MANAIITKYLSDTSIPVETRRKISEGLNTGGLSEMAAVKGISAKYGEKYGTVPSAKDAVAGGLKTVLNAANPKNLGKTLETVGEVATEGAPMAGKVLAEIGKTTTPESIAAAKEQQATDAATRERTSAATQKLNQRGIVPEANPTTNGLFEEKRPLTPDEHLHELEAAEKNLHLNTSPLGATTQSMVDNVGQNFGKIAEGASDIVDTTIIDGDFTEEGSKKAFKGVEKIIQGGVGTLNTIPAGVMNTLPEEVTQPVASAAKDASKKTAQMFLKYLYPQATEEQLNNPEALESIETALNTALTFAGLSKGSNKADKTKLAEREAKSQELGKKAFQSSVPPKVREAELLQQQATGKIPKIRSTADSVYDNGVQGFTKKALGDNALKKADQLWNDKIAPALDKSDDVIDVTEQFKKLQQQIDDVAEPGYRSELQDGLEALKQDYAKTSQLKLSQAQDIKSGLDKFTPTKLFRGKDVANGYTQVKHDFADLLRDEIHKSLPKDVGNAYYDYGNLKELSSIAVNARTQAASMGGAGRLLGDIARAATAPALIVGGKIMYNLGGIWYIFKKTSGGAMEMIPATPEQVAVALQQKK